jgi:hypothetical protein
MLSRLVKGLRAEPGKETSETTETAGAAETAPESDIAARNESDLAFINRALAGVEVEAEQTIDFLELPAEVRERFKYLGGS